MEIYNDDMESQRLRKLLKALNKPLTTNQLRV